MLLEIAVVRVLLLLNIAVVLLTGAPFVPHDAVPSASLTVAVATRDETVNHLVDHLTTFAAVSTPDKVRVRSALQTDLKPCVVIAPERVVRGVLTNLFVRHGLRASVDATQTGNVIRMSVIDLGLNVPFQACDTHFAITMASRSDFGHWNFRFGSRLTANRTSHFFARE